MKTVFATVVTALVAVTLYGCGGDTTTTKAPVTTAAPPVATMTIVQLAQATPSLSTLVTLLVNHSLVETLNGTGPFTVFAPTNDAFTAAADVIATLTQEQITSVLLYHVVAADATAADLTQGESLVTQFAGHNLTVQTITPDVTIHPDGTGAADAKVTSADNMATNGVVHIVNAVLVPSLPAPASTPAPATTPAAPTSAPVTTAAPVTTPSPLPTIVELAQATPSLSTLVDQLVAHNLTDTLSGTGPFTVFAPTDAAFATAQSAIAALTPEQVTNVLLYHVVAADAKAADLSQGESLPSQFAGHSLTVQTITPDVTIHPDGAGAVDAKVTSADNMASNGVVHIVDAVLVPGWSDASNVQVV